MEVTHPCARLLHFLLPSLPAYLKALAHVCQILKVGEAEEVRAVEDIISNSS